MIEFNGQKECGGHEKGGNQIERLAVFDVQNVESRGQDEHASDDGDFRDEFGRDGAFGIEGEEVNGALPTEEDGSCEHHADAVGGGENGGGNKIEGGVGEQIGVVAVYGTVHGAYHGKGADAVEQNARCETFGQFTAGEMGRGVGQPAIQPECSAENATYGHGENEHHGEMAVPDVDNGGVGSQDDGAQPQSIVEGVDVAFADAAAYDGAEHTACDDCSRIDNRTYHIQFFWRCKNTKNGGNKRKFEHF